MDHEHFPGYMFSVFMAISSAAYVIFGPAYIGKEFLEDVLGTNTSSTNSLPYILALAAISSIVGFIIWKKCFFVEDKNYNINLRRNLFNGAISGAKCTACSAIICLIIFHIFMLLGQNDFSLKILLSTFIFFIISGMFLVAAMIPVALLYGVTGGLIYGVFHTLYQYKKFT